MSKECEKKKVFYVQLVINCTFMHTFKKVLKFYHKQ